MRLRGGSVFLKNCKQTAEKCKQIFWKLKKTTASQTHFGFTNMGSEVLSFRVIALRKEQFWLGSPCILSYLDNLIRLMWKCRIRNFQRPIIHNVSLNSILVVKYLQGCRSLLKTGGAWDIWGCTDPYKDYFLGVLLHFYVTMFWQFWKLGVHEHPRNPGYDTPEYLR